MQQKFVRNGRRGEETETIMHDLLLVTQPTLEVKGTRDYSRTDSEE